jgi:hypothetical protein
MILTQSETAGSVSSTEPDFAVWLLPSIKGGPLPSLAQGRSINNVRAEGFRVEGAHPVDPRRETRQLWKTKILGAPFVTW